MKHTKHLFALLLALLLIVPMFAAVGEDGREADAAAWLQLVFDGKYDEADTQLDDTMRAVLEGQGGLPAVIGAMRTYGEVTQFGTPVSEEAGGYLVVTIPITFEKEQLNAEISLDDEGRVAGLYFTPGASDADVALATSVFTALMDGDFDTVDAALTPEMRTAMETAGGLQAQMESVGDGGSFGFASHCCHAPAGFEGGSKSIWCVAHRKLNVPSRRSRQTRCRYQS